MSWENLEAIEASTANENVRVDETLTDLEEKGGPSAIVIAIDNGGSSRINEYATYVNPTYGGGEGEAYLDFIVNTLKPEVDATFRTLDGYENTGIL
ncbi:MAG: alpha/beta hydrolase-fold protein [Bacteroidota bacterium]